MPSRRANSRGVPKRQPPGGGAATRSRDLAEQQTLQVDHLLREVQVLQGSLSQMTARLANLGPYLQSLRELGQGVDPIAEMLEQTTKHLAALGIAVPGDGDGLAHAEARGRAYLEQMVRAKELVPAEELAAAWRVSTRVLVAAEGRHELFSLTVEGKRYYPPEILPLARHLVAAISVRLYPKNSVQKYIFWKRKHGSLNGMTITERLAQGKWKDDVEAVLSMAARYAYEDLLGFALQGDDDAVQSRRKQSTPLLVFGAKK